MQMHELDLPGVFLVDIQKMSDNRGFFARTWDAIQAKETGLVPHFEYSCISRNTAKHTLRGMHYQRHPYGEVKLVRCTKGALFDVVVDLRPASTTFSHWVSVELSAENHRALYIPKGCAHGFLTLEDETEVLYEIAGAYKAEASVGVRFDDPAFGIVWPAAPSVIASRDASYPLFT